MRVLLATCLLILVTGSLGKQLPGAGVRHSSLGLLPENTVVAVGDTVVLRCGVTDPEALHNLQWTEFAHTPAGGAISSNQFVGAHPEAARYRIIYSGTDGETGEYSLEISPVIMADGGTYNCMDTYAMFPDKRQHNLELTVMAVAPNCTTTLPFNSIVLDEAYHTNDCMWDYSGGLAPEMDWTGPGVFQKLTVKTETSVWSGMQFNVQYAMDTLFHQCDTYFTDSFLPVPQDSADNVPTFRYSHRSTTMLVHWGPRYHEILPVKQFYDAGDLLFCTADAFPAADYRWMNMVTLEENEGQTWRVDEAWRGRNQSIRCAASNNIDGTLYSSNVFVAVNVNALTTPTTTTPATTTTTAPAVSECRDLSGSWVSEAPTPGRLCIQLDLDNYGALTGLFTNASDSYSLDVVGRAQANNFGQVGLNGIHPYEIGVSSFIGECHRCRGEEQLLVNVVHRVKGSTCGVPGPVQYTTVYNFRRSTVSTHCPGFPANPM